MQLINVQFRNLATVSTEIDFSFSTTSTIVELNNETIYCIVLDKFSGVSKHYFCRRLETKLTLEES